MRFFALFLLLLFGEVNAQINSGARFTGMANAGAALEDVYSLGNNQAGTASIKLPIVALTYEEHFYSLNSHSFAAMAVMPGRFGNIGLYTNKYSVGHSFNQLRGGVTYARLVGTKLSTAITLNYHQLSIPETFVKKHLTFDLGFQYRLSDDWLLGISFANLLDLITDKVASYQIPGKLRIGMSYAFSEQVLLAMESGFDQNKHRDFHLGIEYSILNWLNLRGGTSVNPFQQYAGAGIKIQRISLEIASSFHPQLGVSPQLSLSYAL